MLMQRRHFYDLMAYRLIGEQDGSLNIYPLFVTAGTSKKSIDTKKDPFRQLCEISDTKLVSSTKKTILEKVIPNRLILLI